METTYSYGERAGFFTFIWTVFLTTALAALVTWLCGGYYGYDFTRPSFMMPEAALYTIDAATRLIYGLSLFLTLRASLHEGTNATAKKASVTLWIITFVMSLAMLPVFFVFKWYLFTFIWLLAMIGVTTAQFIVNFRVSVSAAVTVLPYWGFLIYAACMCFMLI